jgi:DNA-binding XRE family transcriptional regulator
MNMSIAERLQELRKQAGYSQEQVAEMLGISRQAISKWESGQSIADTLLSMITIEKRFSAGDKLPNENELSEKSAMCNLSQGIKNNTLAEVIMTMHEKGYDFAQIAEIVKKTIEEVEAVLKKQEPVLA